MTVEMQRPILVGAVRHLIEAARTARGDARNGGRA